MSAGELWPWLALFGLGAFHGLNPGMGWLFAVALGLQEKSRRAVIRSLLPLALGHVGAITAVVVPIVLAQAFVPQRGLRMAATIALVAFGGYRLVRARHPRWVGMRVGWRDLTLWSFLMAWAHGAGLMLAPVVLGWAPASSHDLPLAAGEPGRVGDPVRWLAALSIHTGGHLVTTGLVALVVYEKLGVALLRRAWFNLDLLWALALIAAGLLTQFL